MRVDDEMCQVKEEMRWETLDESTKKAMFIFALLVFVLVLSSFYDHCNDADDKSEYAKFNLITFHDMYFSR